SIADDRHHGLVAFCEAAMRLSRPLHRRATADPLRKLQIVAHAELIAITEHRRSRQREHEAVGKLDPAPVAAEHGRQPTANAPVVELSVGVRTERVEHGLALRFAGTAKVELVMNSQENGPTEP